MANTILKQNHTITNSFIVDKDNINVEQKLSICNMLEAITQQNDQTLIYMLGGLDFEKITAIHSFVDVIGQAFLNDVITLTSYSAVVDDDRIEIQVSAEKKQRKKNQTILNGRFVFRIKNKIAVQYSLS